MISMGAVERAVFGNRGGSHQLLESSLSARHPVLGTLRFLVDRPAGHVGSEVKWSPYWGCQEIDHWWALWRGEEDLGAPRKNMVTARVALVPVDRCGEIETLDEIFALVGAGLEKDKAPLQPLAGAVANCIASQDGPAIVVGVWVAPLVLSALWARLWPTARASISLRTLFGVESMDSVSQSTIVVIPHELRHRWHGHGLLGKKDSRDELSARWFTGEVSLHEERLLIANQTRLPGELTTLKRIDRMIGCLKRLHVGTGTLADALLVIRTQEALPDGFDLPPDDHQVIFSSLHGFENASIEEVRSASLTTMDTISELHQVEGALARWVENSLPEQNTGDALWILEQHLADTHAVWWRRAIGNGIDAACCAKRQAWAKAIWRWWQARPDGVSLMMRHLEMSSDTEQWLASYAPPDIDDILVNHLAEPCRERAWANLFGRALGSSRPLSKCVDTLRRNVSNPEAGIDVLLIDREAVEIVSAAAATAWMPLLTRALSYTVEKPELLVSTLESVGFLPLFVRHLSQGGAFPAQLLRASFVRQVFDHAIERHPHYLRVVQHLDGRAAPFVLDHPECERVLTCINSELLFATAEEWWRRFLSDPSVGRPPEVLWVHVSHSRHSHLDGVHIASVIKYLRLAPEIDEEAFFHWMNDKGFRWDSGDHKQMAKLMIERDWTTATRGFRWSWKRELKLVAWYARDRLPGFDQFWRPPDGADQSEPNNTSGTLTRRIVVSFLAANPTHTPVVALDEEARAIGDNLRKSKHRDYIEIRTRWAVRPNDLQQILLEDQPTIVHFSGHGTTDAKLVLHSSDNTNNTLISTDALADLFRALRDDIRMVVLNACYSEPQAQVIVNEIDFVVGMSASIRDDAARSFAAAFYRGLAFGRSVSEAFKLGTNAIDLEGKEDVTVPRLFVRPGVDAKTTYLLPRT